MTCKAWRVSVNVNPHLSNDSQVFSTVPESQNRGWYWRHVVILSTLFSKATTCFASSAFVCRRSASANGAHNLRDAQREVLGPKWCQDEPPRLFPLGCVFGGMQSAMISVWFVRLRMCVPGREEEVWKLAGNGDGFGAGAGTGWRASFNETH